MDPIVEEFAAQCVDQHGPMELVSSDMHFFWLEYLGWGGEHSFNAATRVRIDGADEFFAHELVENEGSSAQGREIKGVDLEWVGNGDMQ